MSDLPKALSDNERVALVVDSDGLGRRALDLIDALTAALAEAVARMTVAEAQVDRLAGANVPGKGGPG